jgi:hypothetical protein
MPGICEVSATHVKLAAFYLYLHRIRRRVERDPGPYIDPALAPLDGELSPPRRRKKVLTDAAARSTAARELRELYALRESFHLSKCSLVSRLSDRFGRLRRVQEASA